MTNTIAPPTRLPITRLAPEAYRAMVALGSTVEDAGVEASLLELVRTRVSQINGCAFCLDMHTLDALAGGETPQRLHTLAAWRETPFFTARERAALALAEAATLLPAGAVEDDVYEEAAEHLDDGELAVLIWAIAVINAWNRIAVTTRMTPGRYTPGAH